jgi:hypothetical protein
MALVFAITIVLVIYNRHSIITPVRPQTVPTASVPCRFGFHLRWVELSHSSADVAVIFVYDDDGKVVDSQRVMLAKAPMAPEHVNTGGYEAYSYELQNSFKFPSGGVLSGSGLGTNNNLVVSIDQEYSLVPYWWFK